MRHSESPERPESPESPERSENDSGHGAGAYQERCAQYENEMQQEAVSVAAPASKSLSHRALIAAALARGTSRLQNVLESDDTARTREALESLGAVFERSGAGAYTVTGLGGRIVPPASGAVKAAVVTTGDATAGTADAMAAQPVASGSARAGRPDAFSVYVGESGTTCRLLTAILAAGQGRFFVHGAGRMHTRPIGELAATLERLGAEFSYDGPAGCPPFTLSANGLDPAKAHGKTVSIGCGESSQYLSGLIMAAAVPLPASAPGHGRATGEDPLAITLDGSRAVSWPYVSLTLAMMERFGVSVTVETLTPGAWKKTDWRKLVEAVPGKTRFLVPRRGYAAAHVHVEGDYSGASYLLAAGAIGPRPVRVTGLVKRSLQGDAALVAILEKMGARMQWEEGENGQWAVTVFPARLKGVDVDMGLCPDLVPTVAALAAHASGVTRIRGAAHLKIKESDRIAAPAKELAKAGCRVTVADDGFTVAAPEGGTTALRTGIEEIRREGGVFSAHGDHRMAMSLALLGLGGVHGASYMPVPLDEPACVAKSFPDFWRVWGEIVA